MSLKSKIKGNRIGIIFGTFAPLHKGHISLIHQAKKENDGAIIIPSGYNLDRGDKINLNLNKRYSYIEETFASDPLIIVKKLDETNISRYPNGWQEWTTLLKKIVENSLIEKEVVLTVYASEDDYITNFNNYLPTYIIKKGDRSIIPISATKIREKPLKYWQEIALPFRQHFSKNILITGSQKTGKTTLLHDLSLFFTAPSNTDFLKKYQEKYNINNQEFTMNDYQNLLFEQYSLNKETTNNLGNNGIIFSDINAIIIKAIIDFYSKNNTLNQENYYFLTQLYKEMLKKEQWELIIFIRNPQTSSQFDQYLEQLFLESKFKENIIFIDETNYYNIYDRVIYLVQEKIKLYK